MFPSQCYASTATRLATRANVDEALDAVTSYITFWTGGKEVKVYPNNKPWVTPEIAAILKQRQEMHKSGNTAGVRILQRNING